MLVYESLRSFGLTMSGAPRVRSMNVPDSDARPVLGPGGNKTGPLSARKFASKTVKKNEIFPEVLSNDEKSIPQSSTASPSSPHSHSLHSTSFPSVLRRHEQLLNSNLSMTASCSSDASTDSLSSRMSTGRLIRCNSVGSRRKPYALKPRSVASDDGVLVSQSNCSLTKKRCAWVTTNTDPCYSTFHDEEWGVPVHDDKKLFELLVLSCALAELTWPAILNKRQIFREVFSDFDPVAVSKISEKRLIAPGTKANSLLSELKLRSIIENSHQICKVVEEFGSFDNYIWGFINHKPIVNRFRYPRQVPIKTPKADAISKDMLRRGFRGVGPTVVYSFMQAVGMTNDHLISCFRFHECQKEGERKEENGIKDQAEERKKKAETGMKVELSTAIGGLSFSSSE